jgi:hypothetical protein
MAEQQGGYRRPANPAPVSGPGAMSRRTDGGPAAEYVSGLPYGEGQAFYDLQTSAPMGNQQAAKPQTRKGGRPAGGALVSLTAPTQRPDEPLTTGNPMGPGPGLDALELPTGPTASDTEAIKKYLPELRSIAAQPDAPQGFKAFVRYLVGG